MHTHLRQYLRTDAIVAQFVHIGLFHACLHTEHARKSVRRMAVQNDHNARSCLSNDLHGTRQELTARSFLTQQVSEGRELMHAHQSWRVEADAPFLEGYLFRAGRLVEEGHGRPERSERRREGKEWVGRCSKGWWRDH